MNEPRTKLQAARLAERWSQARLMRIMRATATREKIGELPNDRVLKTELSRWENGHKIPDEEPYRRLFRMIYGLTDEELGFPTDRTRTISSLVPKFGDPVIDYYGRLLQDHFRADSQMGPRHVLPIVEQQVKALMPLVREIRGKDRVPAVDLACRYQEFLGWLYQDSGQPEHAMVWTSRAYDLGLELGDRHVTSYLLMRRSNVASDAGDPAQALVLAEAALRKDPAIQGTMKAVILRQQAHASAALGDAHGCASAIDQAFETLTLPDEVPTLARYCTPQYVAMEGGTCWLTLNRADRALATFTQVPDAWPDDARRDHGLSLARLAVAYAGAGELEEACRIGQQALSVVTVTASARSILQLRQLRQQLRRWRRHPAASRLIAGIGS